MDEKGDGEHIGRNRPVIPRFFRRGLRPPADEPNAAINAWIDLLFNLGQGIGFAVFQEVPRGPEANNNANQENHHSDDSDDDNIENGGINEENVNNEDNVNNVINEDNVNNDDNVINENIDHIDDRNVNVNNIENPSVDNVDNRIDSVEDVDLCRSQSPLSDQFRWWDEFADSDSDGENSSIGSYTGNGPIKQTEYEDAEEDPLPGPSRKRSRQLDEQEESSSKRLRRSSSFSDCDSDSDTESSNGKNNNPDKNIGHAAIKQKSAVVVEEDPLPGSSRKRSRKHDRAEDERGTKKSRQCPDFADSNSGRVTVTTANDLVPTSSRVDPAEDEAAAEETEEEVIHLVKEEEPRPGTSRKRSREEDEDEDERGSKQFKR